MPDDSAKVKADLAAMIDREKDTERLDWLEANRPHAVDPNRMDGQPGWVVACNSTYGKGLTLREAIDNAIRRGNP